MPMLSFQPLRRLLRGGDRTRIPADPRVSVAVIWGFVWTVGAAGLLWGAIYVAVGAPAASLWPFGFSAASVVNGLAFRRHGRLLLFAGVEIALILIVPVALSLQLGGVASSGAVGLWSLLAPIGALLVLGPAWGALTFLLFVVFTGLTVWADVLSIGVPVLSPTTVRVFLFLNIVAVSLVAYWATLIFVTMTKRLAREQQRLREIERAYVAQEAMLRQQERLATLGKLSAGVAHELNNPAAAAGRASLHLRDVVDRLVDNASALLRLGITADGLDWFHATARADGDDPIERGDREEGIATWLESARVPDAWELASELAALGFDRASLDSAAERCRPDQVVAVLRWLVDVARARGLLEEVHTSAGRISGIVSALKGYSHMDRAEVVPLDVDRGLDETLLILRSKLSGLEVVRERGADLPAIEGNPGELNQVWTNLIANAAEAMDGSGTLRIRTFASDDGLVVEIEDDGPGISPELIGRVFDPFVTTKAPGEGTGLGLNLSHQIVAEHHGGAITVESVPGRTCFRVRLPARRASAATAAAGRGAGAAGAPAEVPGSAPTPSSEGHSAVPPSAIEEPS